jgi:hypothetical protein
VLVSLACMALLLKYVIEDAKLARRCEREYVGYMGDSFTSRSEGNYGASESAGPGRLGLGRTPSAPECLETAYRTYVAHRR